jgi:hypothetical protein
MHHARRWQPWSLIFAFVALGCGGGGTAPQVEQTALGGAPQVYRDPLHESPVRGDPATW